MPTQLTAAQTRFLKDLLGKDVLFREEDMYVYASDASLLRGRPLAVVHPRDVETVRAFMRWAHDERMPVYPRARGTNTVGGCVPDPPGIVLSTGHMTAIEEICPKDFVAVVEPGVNTAAFQVECEKRGLFYPPDPASMAASSLGGNVASCAGGMRALKYGVTRDFVLGLEAVLPGGEHIRLGGRNHKNVMGLDLVRLFVGSEGTLGIITKIIVKLLPKPETTASLMAGFSTAEQAMNAVDRVFAMGMLPAALEFMGERMLSCLRRLRPVPWPEGVRTVLLFRLDGSAAAVASDLPRLAACMDTAMWMHQGSGLEEESLWALRRMTSPAAYLEGPKKLAEDIAVPRGALHNALEAIEAIGARHGKAILTLGHVGDGNIHVNIMYDDTDAEDTRRSREALHEVSLAALALGGTLSGEHGAGMVKEVALQLGPEELALMRRVRRAFDPRGILNPGKAY